MDCSGIITILKFPENTFYFKSIAQACSEKLLTPLYDLCYYKHSYSLYIFLFETQKTEL